MRCTGMFWSGAGTCGTRVTLAPRKTGGNGWKRTAEIIAGAFFAAASGVISRRSSAPRAATGTGPTTAAASSVSVSRGRLHLDSFTLYPGCRGGAPARFFCANSSAGSLANARPRPPHAARGHQSSGSGVPIRSRGATISVIARFRVPARSFRRGP